MKKKLLSLALALTLALTLFPTCALAAAHPVSENHVTISDVLVSDEYTNLYEDLETNKEIDKVRYRLGTIGFWQKDDNAWGYMSVYAFVIPQNATITFELDGTNQYTLEGYDIEADKDNPGFYQANFIHGVISENLGAGNHTLTRAEIEELIPGVELLICCVGNEEYLEIMFGNEPGEPTAPTQSTPLFVDVAADAYYAAPVKWAVEKGITSGKTATNFAPGETCTRGQILTFLWRSQGSVTSKVANPFGEQVSTDAYYYPALLWAYENGLLQEYNRKKFNPNEPCTRSDATLFMWHIAGKPSVIWSSRLTDLPTDGGRTSAIMWALSENITQGTTETTFSPDNICTRGQIVTFLYRAYAK